jgi:hypothetical protein
MDVIGNKISSHIWLPTWHEDSHWHFYRVGYLKLSGKKEKVAHVCVTCGNDSGKFLSLSLNSHFCSFQLRKHRHQRKNYVSWSTCRKSNWSRNWSTWKEDLCTQLPRAIVLIPNFKGFQTVLMIILNTPDSISWHSVLIFRVATNSSIIG